MADSKRPVEQKTRKSPRLKEQRAKSRDRVFNSYEEFEEEFLPGEAKKRESRSHELEDAAIVGSGLAEKSLSLVEKVLRRSLPIP